MKLTLADYRQIVGDDVYFDIYSKMRHLYGKHMIHINSTYMGGGVAEILNSLVPLMNDIGLDAGWRIIHGNVDFFGVTKKFHNALQGQKINFSQMKKELFVQVNRRFSTYTHISSHDMVIIHDPQPLPLITFYKKRQPWIWRCHIDLSTPNKELWDYLKEFILRYDLIIVSNEKYLGKDLKVDHRIIQPSIDPLTHKNKPINGKIIEGALKKQNIPTDKPLVTQISRFDKWKDPVGVVEVFRKIREEFDCRLVLCGNMATDDPEGLEIYEKIKRMVNKEIQKREVILVTAENSILVNALQRASAVIFQKSLREGFGLTVTEALWKEKPVIASNVGGIPLQIEDGVNGFLCEPTDNDAFARRAIDILKHPDLGHEMGKKGKKTVLDKFLITRSLSDYLDLLNDFNH
ncbi:glycosyltransferase [Candidatus Latescibacterota bacterium]